MEHRECQESSSCYTLNCSINKQRTTLGSAAQHLIAFKFGCRSCDACARMWQSCVHACVSVCDCRQTCVAIYTQPRPFFISRPRPSEQPSLQTDGEKTRGRKTVSCHFLPRRFIFCPPFLAPIHHLSRLLLFVHLYSEMSVCRPEKHQD